MQTSVFRGIPVRRSATLSRRMWRFLYVRQGGSNFTAHRLASTSQFTMTSSPCYSPFSSVFFVGSISVLAFVLYIVAPEAADGAIVREKHVQHPELLSFFPLLWKNEGLLFADILLQKMLLPFGLTSPYTNLFITEAVRDIASSIAAVKADVGPRRLRGRRLQDDEETAKEVLRCFARSLHAALRGNIFDINFADELIKHLPAGISGQIASVTEAFGKDILRVLAEADNPASAIVTHLLGSLDNGEVPVFNFGGTEGTTGEMQVASRRLQPSHHSNTGIGKQEQHRLTRILPGEEAKRLELNRQVHLLRGPNNEYNDEVYLTQYHSEAMEADDSSGNRDRSRD